MLQENPRGGCNYYLGSCLNQGHFLGFVLRVPYYIGDPDRDPDLGNYPLLWVVRGFCGDP